VGRESASWRADSLGEVKRLELDQGPLEYFDVGSGPPVVFVHGALVNANLWRKVVGPLSDRARCITLDLPLGAHRVPMPDDADLSPYGLADLIGDAIARLELDEVTLVGNDTGGALCQLVATRRPESLGRLVLTSCDAFENFPPKAIRPMVPLMVLPGVMVAMFTPFRLKPLRRRGLTMMGVAKRPADIEAVDAYTFPALQSRKVRRDFKKAMRGMDKRYTLEAAKQFGAFDRPTLIAWSREDRFFPRKHAERLAELFPQGRLEWIEDAYTLSPEDQPDRLAELIRELTAVPAVS
jgi:pimeloyl-ACP methyl ester carboxylesterase